MPRWRVFSGRAWYLALAVLMAAGCDGSDPARAPGAQVRLGGVLGPSDAQGFARAVGPRAFVFPRDHGPHPEFRSEWWYLTVMLRDPEGAEFGVQFTVFRQGLDATLAAAANPTNPWRSGQIYMAHAAVTSVGAQAHWEAQRLARAHPALAGVIAHPFAATVDGWRLSARDGDFSAQRLQVDASDFSVDLALDVLKGPVLQGQDGWSAKGPNQASYYYSVPRLAARGTITVDGDVHSVRGSGWMDREWSTSVLSPEQQGWDWFALHFDDATELMAFRLRRTDATRDPHDHGLMVRADASTRVLGAADFELVPLRYWRDEAGVSWPVAWTLSVGETRWRVEALVDDQRMDTAIVYWEGLVRVLDDSGARVGTGYMELTGYGA